MKKYYFNPVFRSLIYVFIVLFFLAVLIFAIIARDTTSPQSTIIVVSFCGIVDLILLFWIGFSFSMRIQIDYEKEELYIRHPYFLKRLKFQDVLSIQIIDYHKTAFDFIITTRKGVKKLAYARYHKKRQTEKRVAKVTELKQDLLNISNRNYQKY